MIESTGPHPRMPLLTAGATFVLTLGLAVAGAAILVTPGGCYKPHVTSGELGCAPSGKPCPDGFECGPGDRCFTIGQGPGSGGAGGTGGMPGTGGTPGGTGGSGEPNVVGETCLI